MMICTGLLVSRSGTANVLSAEPPPPPSCVPRAKPSAESTEESQYVKARKNMVDDDLRGRDITDAKVLEVMGRIPRHRFLPENLLHLAYADMPLPIGHGQTIFQPYVVGRSGPGRNRTAVACTKAAMDPKPLLDGPESHVRNAGQSWFSRLELRQRKSATPILRPPAPADAANAFGPIARLPPTKYNRAYSLPVPLRFATRPVLTRGLDGHRQRPSELREQGTVCRSGGTRGNETLCGSFADARRPELSCRPVQRR